MAIQPFLAMTAAEIRQIGQLPEKTAWMACHFSPYGRGLSNLPRTLPPGALLIVDDITPIHGHEPCYIKAQLAQCAEILDLSGILLDFQRPDSSELFRLSEQLSKGLPCPVAVSEIYARGLDAPVFLSPVPPSIGLEEYLLPWQHHEVWLDVACCCEHLQLTEDGCIADVLTQADFTLKGFSNEELSCHYRIHTAENTATFTLWRTAEDLNHLLQKAENLGITHAVGLYQELFYLKNAKTAV